MNDAPKTLSFKGQKIRVIIIDGEAWFAVKDVCNAIGILSYAKIFQLIGDDEKKIVQFPDAEKESYSHLSFINEDALFRLIFKCASNEAETFAKWINSHALPELHRECFNAHDEEAVKLRSIQEKITQLQLLIKTAGILLCLPKNISLRKATQLLETYGFTSN